MGYGFNYQLIMTGINKDRHLFAAKELFSVWKNTPKFWQLVVFCIVFSADCEKWKCICFYNMQTKGSVARMEIFNKITTEHLKIKLKKKLSEEQTLELQYWVL